MEDVSSLAIAPELVREQTALAPLLVQTEGLIVSLLTELLGTPVTVRPLTQELNTIGFIRKTLLETADLPLYLAVTIVRRLPETRALIATMRKHPTMPFGTVLGNHGLFGHKSSLSIRRAVYLPEYQALFETDGDVTEVWERSYAIVSPKNKRIIGVTEIFSPRLEAWLREHPERVPPLPAERTAEAPSTARG